MDQETKGAGTEQSTSAKPDWTLLGELSNNQEIVFEQPKTETVEENQIKDTTIVDQPAQVDAEKKEETKVEETEVKEGEKKEEAKVVEETEKPLIEFKAEDIEGAPTQFEDGTWQGLAQDFGFTIDKEDPSEFQEKFKETYILKSELPKLQIQSKEQLYSTLMPETAAALELKELGIPENLIFEPTKEIDSLLSLTDAELCRKALEARKGYTQEMVDSEMEELATDNGIKVKADIVRVNLSNDKEQILTTRTNLVQKLTADRERVALQQKQEEVSQFMKALDNKPDFMGVPLTKDVKAAIAAKFQKGLYDDKFKAAESKVEQALYLDLGEKLAKHIQTKSFAKGRESEVVKKANIPPLNNASGSRTENKNQEESKENPFSLVQF